MVQTAANSWLFRGCRVFLNISLSHSARSISKDMMNSWTAFDRDNSDAHDRSFVLGVVGRLMNRITAIFTMPKGACELD